MKREGFAPWKTAVAGICNVVCASVAECTLSRGLSERRRAYHSGDGRCAHHGFTRGAGAASGVGCRRRHRPYGLGRGVASPTPVRVVRLGRTGDRGEASGRMDSRCELPPSSRRCASRRNPQRASWKGCGRHWRLLPGGGLGALARRGQPSRAAGAARPVGSLVACSLCRSRGDHQRNLRLTSETRTSLAY